MSDSYQTPAPATVALPPIAWMGGHPTVADREPAGTRLRRCIRCSARSQFDALRCEPGMVVHLIDPADVHARPELFDGVTWAEPEAIAGAHAHWKDKGFRVTRKPEGPIGESIHPRYRPCPQCNEELMARGELTVVLPDAGAPVRARGRGGR